MKKHNKKAFTLVELLVVIAIIAILAVVSIVGYTAFTQKARKSVAQQELSQLVNLLTAEELTNDDLKFTDSGLEYTFVDPVAKSDSEGANTYTVDVSKETLATWFDELKEDLETLKGTIEINKEVKAVSGDPVEETKYYYTVTVTMKSITYTKDGASATYDFVRKEYTD